MLISFNIFQKIFWNILSSWRRISFRTSFFPGEGGGGGVGGRMWPPSPCFLSHEATKRGQVPMTARVWRGTTSASCIVYNLYSLPLERPRKSCQNATTILISLVHNLLPIQSHFVYGVTSCRLGRTIPSSSAPPSSSPQVPCSPPPCPYVHESKES